MGTASKSAIAPVGPRGSFRRGDRHAATGIHAADSDGQIDQFFPVRRGPCGCASIIRHPGRGRGRGQARILRRLLDRRGQGGVIGVDDENRKQLGRFGRAGIPADRMGRVGRFRPAFAGMIDARLAVVHL